ncbi:MAG TPA: amino acid ABC transporter permease, partial [Actinomycetota bacterium]|nr:amino acid ABC transporter permease [Actinomycetota bacterium]
RAGPRSSGAEMAVDQAAETRAVPDGDRTLETTGRWLLGGGAASIAVVLLGPLVLVGRAGLAASDTVASDLVSPPSIVLAVVGVVLAASGFVVLRRRHLPEVRLKARMATVGGMALIVLGPLAMAAIQGLVPYTVIVDVLLAPTTFGLVIGGALLGAVAAAAGYVTYRRMPTKRSREQAVSGAILGLEAVVFAAIFLVFTRLGNPDRFVFHFANIEFLRGSGDVFVRAAFNTILLAAVGEVGGIVFGLLLSILVLSKRAVVRAPARVYINFFRGTPLIWQLSVFWFGLSLGLGFRFPDVRLGALHLSPTYLAAMVVFVLNTGAYAAEVFRAGIQSIERGQMEAARGLGMTYLQSMRYAIVPQAVRRVIPPLMNEFVILIKDTSLVIVLGLAADNFELFTQAREGYSATFNASFFTAAAAGYLIVTLPLIRLVNAVERRLRSGLVGVI